MTLIKPNYDLNYLLFGFVFNPKQYLITYPLCLISWTQGDYRPCGGTYLIGRPKSPFSSRNEKYILETTFSHYLGLKQCRKTKIEKIHEYLLLVKGVQIFST